MQTLDFHLLLNLALALVLLRLVPKPQFIDNAQDLPFDRSSSPLSPLFADLVCCLVVSCCACNATDEREATMSSWTLRHSTQTRWGVR